MFTASGFTKSNSISNNTITLENLKQILLDQEYSKQISIKCIEDDYSCFVILDGNLEEHKIDPIFNEQPTVYTYSKELEKLEFADLELKQFKRYPIVFEYTCKQNQTCSEMIVETDAKIYIFNDMYKRPKIVAYINDVDEYFEAKIREVKDAF